MWKWLQKSKDIKKDLFNFKNEPLTNISIFLLITLDIFIFTNVMIGVTAEMDKVPKAYLYYPTSCTKHFESIQSTYTNFNSSPYRHVQRQDHQNSYCKELENKINIFRSNNSFQINLTSIQSIKDKQNKNNRELEKISKKYNTRLFESIAKIPNNSALKNAKHKYDALISDNRRLDKELKAIPPLSSLDDYNDYLKYIEDNKKSFFKSKESYTFWQPFKAYVHMLIFIMPLLLFFGFFYARTKKKQLMHKNYNPIVKIISANISLILALPLVWYTLTLFYHVLPKTLLKDLIEFLMDNGLISLLNYFAILSVVLILGVLIYYIQKRTLKLKKDISGNQKQQKLISWSQCFKCEFKIDYKNEYCPFCGTKLHENCLSCNKKMIINELYCAHCGDKKKVDNNNKLTGSTTNIDNQ